MPCVWDTPFSGPICSGDAEQHDAPEELYAPAGSVVYGCDADVYLVDGALCGTGSWTLGRDAQMSVGGAGTFYMYYNVSVPEFLSPADPVGRSGSDTSSLSIVIPGSVFASAVVRMAPQSITYQVGRFGITQLLVQFGILHNLFCCRVPPTRSSRMPSPTRHRTLYSYNLR